MKKIYLLAAVFCMILVFSGCTADYDGTKGLDFEESGAGYAINAYDGDEPVVNIPKTYKDKKVIGIKKGTFSGNKTVDAVNIPSTVRRIDSGAFADNPNLERVSVPKSVKEIKKEAFSNNKKLTIYCRDAEKQDGWSYKWNDGSSNVSWNNSSGDIQVWKSLADVKILPENSKVQTEGARPAADYRPKAKKKEYTVLYYINGRDRLDYLYSEELKSVVRIMENNPDLSEKVNVVAEVASGTYFDCPELQKDTNYRFTVDAGGIGGISDVGLRSAGEASTVSDFINFGIESYPAENTILILNGSGTDARGEFWSDELFGEEGGGLTAAELKEALSESAASEDKLKFLVMKADGYANAEWAYQMASCADTLIASPGRMQKTQESQNWMTSLGADSAGKAASALLDELNQEMAMDAERAPFTAVNLEKTKNALKQWSGSLTEMSKEELRDSMEKADEMQQNSEVYYDGYYTGSPVDMNLTEFAQAAFPELAKQLESGGIKGLSVYMPRSFYDTEQLNTYELFSKMDGYTRYVKAMEEFENTGEVPDLSDMKPAKTKREGIYLNYEMPDMQALYEVQFVRDEKAKDVLYVYGYDNGGKIGADGRILEKISTGTLNLKEELLCAIEQTASEETVHLYEVPVLINGEFDLLQVSSSSQDVISALKNRKDALTEKDEITPLYPIVTSRPKTDELFKSDKYYKGQYYKGEAFKLKGLPKGGSVRLGRSPYENSQRLFLMVGSSGQQVFTFAGK